MSIHSQPITVVNYAEFLERSKKQFYQNIYIRDEKSIVPITDFECIKKLGAGAFGNVVLAKYVPKSTYHAIKMISKNHVMKTKQWDHTRNEKRILLVTKHPQLMNMEYFAADRGSLYFIMPFLNGGDLFHTFSRMHRFEEKVTKFYAAQVFLGLEYLHYLNVIYRDLKPENIVLDQRGYAKITDFGFCKIISKGRTYTICGTPEYIAPELVLMKGYAFSADWWSFGIFLYELTAGVVPFRDTGDHVRLYNAIVMGKFEMPAMFSTELRDLIGRLLQVDITKRIGCLNSGPMEIREHEWFSDIPWLQIFNKRVVPPIKPFPQNPDDYEHEKIQFGPEPDVDKYESVFEDF